MENRETAIQLLQQFRNCRFKDLQYNDSGMGFVLIYMRLHEGDITAKMLSEEMDVSMARITTLIQQLEKKKLVVRKSSCEDGRVNYLFLTEEGIEKSTILIEKSIGIVSKIIDKLGVDEIQRFINNAMVIKSIIEECNS